MCKCEGREHRTAYCSTCDPIRETGIDPAIARDGFDNSLASMPQLFEGDDS